MTGRNAFVPEVAVYFIDFFEAAYQQPFEIELRSNAQIKVYVQSVVMSNKGTRSGPPAMGCIMGVSTSRKPRSSRKLRYLPNDASTLDEYVPHLWVDNQVNVTLAVTQFYVF